MRKTYFIASLSLVVLFSLVVGCKKPDVPSVAELVKKVWTVSQVDANSTTVYKRGATGNIYNYAAWKLDLSNPPMAIYTDYDGTVFTGNYSVPNDNTIILTNLTPSPTGDNGTITFTINSVDSNNLKLTRTTTSQKTGGTINVYTATNP